MREKKDLDIKVGDTVVALDSTNGLVEGKEYTVDNIRKGNPHSRNCGEDFFVYVEGASAYIHRFKKCEPVPTPSPSYETKITVEITDEDDVLYEQHIYCRHAESPNESENLFWSFVDRYGKDSFFTGMVIHLVLEEQEEIKLDIIVKPHGQM